MNYEKLFHRIKMRYWKESYQRPATPAVRAALGIFSLPLLALWVLLTGCGEPNEPFNSVDRFRMLGIKAEPPSLAVGELAELSVLFHAPKGTDVTYKWSWCPFATSPSDGTQCLVSEADLQDMVEAYLRENAAEDLEDSLPDGVEVPEDLEDLLPEDLVPSFDLGTDPTARFAHVLPVELLEEMCRQMIADEVPAFTGVPRCDDKLDVVIRLEIAAGGETLYGVKKLPLYIDPERADNENPVIGDLAVFDDETDRRITETDGVRTLPDRSTYRLVADIPADAPDLFTPLATDEDSIPTPVKESMFMTWYVTGGETEFVRTTFFDGEIPLEELRENFWRIPTRNTLESDDLLLYLVLQDERGGMGWLSRRFTVKEGSR